MDEATLYEKVFPSLAETLRSQGELYVPYDYATHFVHWLMHTDHALWQRTEQEALITENYEARLFLKEK